MLLDHTKIIEIYLQFRSNVPLFGIDPAFASRLRLRVMRDPVMRAMESGGWKAVGGCQAGHMRQPSTRVVVMGFFSRSDENLWILRKEMRWQGFCWLRDEMDVEFHGVVEHSGEGGARCQGFRGCVPRENGKLITRGPLSCLRQV